MAKTLIIIAGPTAIGKTTLAIKLALHYQTEIISADSRQFYKEMCIGTAKPSSAELQSATHHFIDSHSITDKFTVGDYEKVAVELMHNLFAEHDQLILVGGSGLFINAIINGFDDLPTSNENIRADLNKLLKQAGILHLQKKLKEADPFYYSEVDINNPQRLIRALEVYETTGKPFSEFRKKTKKKREFDIIQLGLMMDREKLYENINKRVDNMISEGLLDEVEKLKSHRNLNPLNTVGYSELFDYFDGKCTLTEAIDKIKQNTRRFAKRQITWFKKSEDIKWFQPDTTDQIIKYLDLHLEYPALAEQKN